MARSLTSSCKFCRRENMKLFLKGDRCYSDKCAFERRSYPPGQHGKRSTKLSDYGLQLREKQKVKRIYGTLERQFSNYFDRANRQKGATGMSLLRRLEIRLDNVVYRLGFADSRNEARQLLLHGHYEVNGKPVNIANVILRTGDEVGIRAKSQKITPIMRAMENAKKREVPDWLALNPAEFKGKVKYLPERNQVTLPIEESLVVELYSR
ncbi:MAG: 30S ribosomal protein S4 [Deltaproteobacteria bacterium]|nr:30S ribosomal protein S4 [Deltaproteobacteria bacterium]